MSILIVNSDIDEYNRGSLFAEIEIEKILNEYLSKLSKEDLISKLLESQQNTLIKLSNKIILDKSWESGYNSSFKNIICGIENEEESEDER